MQTFHLSPEHRHLNWDRHRSPEVTLEPGDEISLELVDASGGQIGAGDDASAVARMDFSGVNPCTGPVALRGAREGDELVVTIVDVTVGSWAWTANIPGFGLLADDFPEPHLWISSVRDGVITTPIGATLAARPMIGTIGVAARGDAPTPLLVPTLAGGNMDIPQIGAGTVLRVPVQVPDALFSAGDSHAVQGDGEICGTGAETSATVQLRLDVAPYMSAAPWFDYVTAPTPEQRWTATTGIGPDLFAAARDATRRAVELLARRAGVAAIDAYLLLSLVGELRIAEIVDAPNWVVTMNIPSRYVGG